MTRSQGKRAQRLSRTLHSIPIPKPVPDSAWDQLLEEGVLPDNDRLTKAVLDRALVDSQAHTKSFDEIIKIAMGKAPPDPPDLRPMLFDEALHEEPVVRQMARRIIERRLDLLYDIETPDFLEGVEPPVFGPLAFSIVGFPERWLSRPGAGVREHRLLACLHALKERIPEHREWFSGLQEAVRGVVERGQTPEDKLHRQCIGLLRKLPLPALREDRSRT